MPVALRAHSLWKSYAAGVVGCSARVWVLRAASLEVQEGECIAVLGKRGAGVTTLLHCLAGLRRVDAGTIEHCRRPHLVTPSPAPTARNAPSHAGDIVLVDDTVEVEWPGPVVRAVHEPADRGVTTIIATHELSSIRHLVDRALLLRDGRLIPLPLHSGARRVAERPVAAPTSTKGALRRRPTTVGR